MRILPRGAGYGTPAAVTEPSSAYWNHFYELRRPEIEEPSSFARVSRARLRPELRLFELGCGNGRDALFFAAEGLRVTACDQSAVAIERLAGRGDLGRFVHRPQFVQADFAAMPGGYRGELDVVYSRFSMHAVPATVASAALAWAFAGLRAGGQLLLEARSVAGSLYGKGLAVEGDADAFIHDGHYRRFLRSEALTGELTQLGFVVRELVEAAGLAIYKDDDPVVIRVVAEKPER